jgi:CheY-like chemotaxis protein/anti-sigma regulatory factor (Ser/Thr protein kinase)
LIDRGAAPLGTVHLDVTKLRQAVLNLISNAAKFTHNGEITLRIRRLDNGDGDWVQIAVIDTGVGISLDQQKALFSKFTQANAKVASKYGGTGLGLALSQNLCRVMGGDITVQSRPGQGSCFTIHLPAVAQIDANDPAEDDALVADAEDDVRARAEGYAGLSENPLSSKPKLRVLVVDDDRSFLELVERLLLKEGFSAICSSYPRSVRQLARSAQPDAILLDILMPDFDGWAVLESLKQDPVTAKIPVVVLSIVDERKRALDAGAAGIVTKPVDRAELLRAIGEACVPSTRKSKANRSATTTAAA